MYLFPGEDQGAGFPLNGQDQFCFHQMGNKGLEILGSCRSGDLVFPQDFIQDVIQVFLAVDPAPDEGPDVLDGVGFVLLGAHDDQTFADSAHGAVFVVGQDRLHVHHDRVPSWMAAVSGPESSIGRNPHLLENKVVPLKLCLVRLGRVWRLSNPPGGYVFEV